MLFKRINFSNMSDDELIQYYKRHKDKECVGELYKRYTGFAFTICLKYLKDTEKARETTLEIFEELLDKLLLHDVRNFKPWLHSVIRNHCLLIFRDAKSKNNFDEKYKQYQNNFMEDEDILYPNYILKEDNYENLEKNILKLKEEQRICLELFYFKNKSYVEVSHITGFTMNEVKTYMQNGKRNLKNLMTNSNE